MHRWFLVIALMSLPLKAAQPNVLFIMIDDLRNDLGTLGVKHAKTPHLDAFAATARVFPRHYVQVPTCGASRAALLRGKYPSEPAHLGNGAIASSQASGNGVNLPQWFQKHGYKTMSLGKVTHYPGGRTGKLWANGPEELPNSWERAWLPETPWRFPQHLMHGYANGRPRISGRSAPWESFEGSDLAYPDAWIASEAIRTLRELASSDEPWFFAVGFFKPHLPFAAPQRWFDLHDPKEIPSLGPDVAAKPTWPSGWHRSGEFRGNYGHDGRDPSTDQEYARLLRQAYAACVSYVDAQAGLLLDAVQGLRMDQNTIVIVWSDHGFLLGEHAIWGKHCLYEHALRSPLMIRIPEMPEPGAQANAIVQSIDLFPTLTDLCGLPTPDHLDGTSLRPQLENPKTPTERPAIAFWTGGQRTIRTDQWRLIADSSRDRPSPAIELFDYATDPDETRNHAGAHPAVVADLLGQLQQAPSP